MKMVNDGVRANLRARRAARWLLNFVTVLALLVVALSFVGCGTTVEACYVHPEYGQVCVTYNGKLHIRADISADPAKLEAVKDWLKKQGADISD